MSDNKENNYEDAAKRDLEKREEDGGLFEAEQKRREKEDGGQKTEAKPTALGKVLIGKRRTKIKVKNSKWDGIIFLYHSFHQQVYSILKICEFKLEQQQ